MVGNLVEGYKNTGINIRQEVEASEIQRLHLSRKTSSISTSLPTTLVLHFDTACKFIWLLVKNQTKKDCIYMLCSFISRRLAFRFIHAYNVIA